MTTMLDISSQLFELMETVIELNTAQKNPTTYEHRVTLESNFLEMANRTVKAIESCAVLRDDPDIDKLIKECHALYSLAKEHLKND